MSKDDKFFSDLEQDRESTTHQLYFLENLNKNMIFLVKECEEVESRILKNCTSSDNETHNEVETLDDQFNVVNSESATMKASAKIHKKSSLAEGVQENNDGFQTPTKFQDNELSSNDLRCPPAPRKPKAKPLRKRKRVCRNLQIEFVHEVESALKLVINECHLRTKKTRSQSR